MREAMANDRIGEGNPLQRASLPLAVKGGLDEK